MNLFPEIKEILVNVFDKYRYVLDSELQQRASEYYALATREDSDQLLQIVCDEMPPFPERESALLTSLDRKHGDTQDSRTWIIGGKDANRDRNVVRAKSLNKKAQGGILSRGSVLSPTFTGSTGVIEAQPTGQSSQNEQLLSPQGTQNNDFVAPLPEKTTSGISLSAAPIHIVRNDAIDNAYMHLLYNYEGVLYDSDFLKVVVRSEYQGPLGRLILQIINKVASATLTSFSATIDSSNDDALNVTFPQIMSNSKIVGGESVKQSVHVECKDVYSEPPTLRMSYIAGSHQTLALRFPLLLSKFLEPVEWVIDPLSGMNLTHPQTLSNRFLRTLEANWWCTTRSSNYFANKSQIKQYRHPENK